MVVALMVGGVVGVGGVGGGGGVRIGVVRGVGEEADGVVAAVRVDARLVDDEEDEAREGGGVPFGWEGFSEHGFVEVVGGFHIGLAEGEGAFVGVAFARASQWVAFVEIFLRSLFAEQMSSQATS